MASWNVPCVGFLILGTILPGLLAYTLQVTTIPSPSTFVEGTNNRVIIRCPITSNSSVGVEEQLNRVEITFMKSSSVANRTLARLTSSGASILDANITQRATVEGQITANPVATSFVLTINNATCTEVGHYTCHVNFRVIATQVEHNIQATSAIEGKSLPGEIHVLHQPPKEKYNVGERVQITCSANVGKPGLPWSWQWQEGNSWVPYPRDFDISSTNPVPLTDCAEHSSTTLNYEVTSTEKIKFRCVIGSDVDTSQETSINGDVSGAKTEVMCAHLVGTCLLLWATLMRWSR